MASPSEPHSLESFDALPDDGARDAAIARALGKERRCTVCGEGLFGTHTDARCHGRFKHVAPFYYTGGDADPFANWGLLAEVWRALRRGNMFIPTMVDWGDGSTDGWRMYDEPDEENRDIRACAATPHRAACRALVAAGLVPKEAASDEC